MKSACYCGTRNLYGDMLPALKSLLKNSEMFGRLAITRKAGKAKAHNSVT